MKCKLDIRDGIVESAGNMIESQKIKKIAGNTFYISNNDWASTAQAYKVAENAVKKINTAFDSVLAFREQYKEGHNIVIKPSASLIDEYWNTYQKQYKQSLRQLQEEDARAVQKQDAERAGIEYTDEYLFSENDSDLYNLNFSEEMIKSLYDTSSKRLTRDNFAKEAYRLVNNLRPFYTNQEILEKLKCL